jgi:hypothetical protein
MKRKSAHKEKYTKKLKKEDFERNLDTITVNNSLVQQAVLEVLTDNKGIIVDNNQVKVEYGLFTAEILCSHYVDQIMTLEKSSYLQKTFKWTTYFAGTVGLAVVALSYYPEYIPPLINPSIRLMRNVGLVSQGPAIATYVMNKFTIPVNSRKYIDQNQKKCLEIYKGFCKESKSKCECEHVGLCKRQIAHSIVKITRLNINEYLELPRTIYKGFSSDELIINLQYFKYSILWSNFLKRVPSCQDDFGIMILALFKQKVKIQEKMDWELITITIIRRILDDINIEIFKTCITALFIVLLSIPNDDAFKQFVITLLTITTQSDIPVIGMHKKELISLLITKVANLAME